VILVAGLLSACTNGPDTTIIVGKPDLQPTPATIDFGEVQVNHSATATLDLHNDGIGDLDWTAQYLGVPAIRLVDEAGTVDPNSTGPVQLAFSPDVEGTFEGTLILDSNDEDFPHVEIPVQGTGVIPHLVISPDSLYFGTVVQGDSVTRQTTLSSTGSGPVVISDIVFPGAEGTAYSWVLPEEATLPYTLDPGFSVALGITYAPPTNEQVAGQLIVASNDQVEPNQPITLISGDDPDGTQPPSVEIVTPQWGTRWLPDETIDVKVHAVDEDDAPQNLTVLLYVDNALVGSASPDDQGWYETTVGPLAGGVAHDIRATAIDPASHLDQDDVSVAVDDLDDIHYTLSGGESIFEYWAVDDDVRVYVNGNVVYEDQNGHQTTNAPVQFEAARGDSIRIVGTDATQCRKEMDDLFLHFGTDRHEQIVTMQSASACPQDPDYDPNYDGPWPNDFFDQTFTIDLP